MYIVSYYYTVFPILQQRWRSLLSRVVHRGTCSTPSGHRTGGRSGAAAARPAGASPRPGAAWTRTLHRPTAAALICKAGEEFSATVTEVRRASFLIRIGGEAAGENAQAPGEDLNVEGLSGGDFIRLQACAPALHPRKRRPTSAEFTSSSVSGGKSGGCRGDPAPRWASPQRGQGAPGPGPFRGVFGAQPVLPLN